MANERITVFSGAASEVVNAVAGGSGAASEVVNAVAGGSGAASELSDAVAGASDELPRVPGAPSDVPGEREQEAALDALLAHADTPLPPEGLEERVLEAIRREESSSLPSSASLPVPRLRSMPWFARRRVWLSSAAAACLFAALVPLLLPPGEEKHDGEALAIDDAILVDDALDLIADEELITAICSVSTGKDSLMSNQ